MNIVRKAKLEKIRDDFFDMPRLEGDAKALEDMYQAFKARIMLECVVDGGSCEGVVYGHLESRS